MTNEHDQNDSPDEKQLHDAAAEAAEEAIESLRQLYNEGIPQRAYRLRGEMFQIIEVLWLISALVRGRIEDRSEEGEPAADITEKVTLLQFSIACEGCLHQALHALEPLAINDAGKVLDAYLDGVMEGALKEDGPGMEWIRGFFTGPYQDGDRDQKVEQLNALFGGRELAGEEEG